MPSCRRGFFHRPFLRFLSSPGSRPIEFVTSPSRDPLVPDGAPALPATIPVGGGDAGGGWKRLSKEDFAGPTGDGDIGFAVGAAGLVTAI